MPYMSYIYWETTEKISKRRTEITRKKQIIDRITELQNWHVLITGKRKKNRMNRISLNRWRMIFWPLPNPLCNRGSSKSSLLSFSIWFYYPIACLLFMLLSRNIYRKCHGLQNRASKKEKWPRRGRMCVERLRNIQIRPRLGSYDQCNHSSINISSLRDKTYDHSAEMLWFTKPCLQKGEKTFKI
jgi:hypothetical protein